MPNYANEKGICLREMNANILKVNTNNNCKSRHITNNQKLIIIHSPFFGFVCQNVNKYAIITVKVASLISHPCNR